jgi:protein SCO1
MSSYSRTAQWLVWSFLALVIVVIAGAYLWKEWNPPGDPLPVYGTVSDFSLTDQLGGEVSLADLRGKIWVANIIFTRCAGPCAEMTRQMRLIQKGLPAGKPVQLISLTTDPSHDTPAVLKRYAERFEARPENWKFLTGSRREIYRFVTQDLRLVVEENDPEQLGPDEDLFVHSTKFVLIDGEGRVRSYAFDGTEAGSPARILAAIKVLLKEK